MAPAPLLWLLGDLAWDLPRLPHPRQLGLCPRDAEGEKTRLYLSGARWKSGRDGEQGGVSCEGRATGST